MASWQLNRTKGISEIKNGRKNYPFSEACCLEVLLRSILDFSLGKKTQKKNTKKTFANVSRFRSVEVFRIETLTVIKIIT